MGILNVISVKIVIVSTILKKYFLDIKALFQMNKRLSFAGIQWFLTQHLL